jgi:predicted ribosome quality control (RQC) complex YloA/Tae2 family protein
MNRVGLKAILSEIAPRLLERRVAQVRAPGPGTVIIDLADPAGESLVISTSRALPLIFLAETNSVPVGGSTPQEPRLLRGGTITSAGLTADGARAVLGIRRTDPVGIASDTSLIVDLGRSAVLTTAPGRPADTVAPDGAPSEAAVSWWRDAEGRLHVRIGVSPHRNATEHRVFGSWNDAARFAFREHAGTIEDDHRRSALVRSLERRLKRKRRAVERVRRDLEQARGADEHRRRAQLLLARQGEFRRGSAVQRLTDYDGSTTLEVEVDPRLGAVENAEALFRRAKKAERVATRAPARLRELEREIEEFEREIDATTRASGGDLERLGKRHAPPEGQRPRRPEERIRFRRYVVSGDWEVLVGKSNRDNDLLTQRVAAPSDLWFHARQAPGSHVVLRRAGRKDHPDKRAILEAAAIAAYHSKAGKSSKVAVLYTEKRHVRKPRGAKPGLVTVSREQVVLVRPAVPEGSAPDD